MPILLVSVSEAQMSEEEIRCCCVKWWVFMGLGSWTLSLLCGAGLLLSTSGRLSLWRLLDTGSWASLCHTEEVSDRVHVVSPSVPLSEMEVSQELLCSQRWVFPPYMYPLLPTPPSHFQHPSWLTVGPRAIHVKLISKQPAILEVWEKQCLVLCVDIHWFFCRNQKEYH